MDSITVLRSPHQQLIKGFHGPDLYVQHEGLFSEGSPLFDAWLTSSGLEHLVGKITAYGSYVLRPGCKSSNNPDDYQPVIPGTRTELMNQWSDAGMTPVFVHVDFQNLHTHVDQKGFFIVDCIERGIL